MCSHPKNTIKAAEISKRLILTIVLRNVHQVELGKSHLLLSIDENYNNITSMDVKYSLLSVQPY